MLTKRELFIAFTSLQPCMQNVQHGASNTTIVPIVKMTMHTNRDQLHKGTHKRHAQALVSNRRSHQPKKTLSISPSHSSVTLRSPLD